MSWESIPLGYCVSEVRDKNVGGREQNLLSLSYGNIVRKDIDSAEGLLPESFDTYNTVRAGDTVLRLTDLQNDQRSLRVGLVAERGIITSAYVSLRPTQMMESRFLNYFLKNLDFQKHFYALGAGVRQSLKFDELRKISVPQPPLKTQKAIADFLDSESARIDALIDKKKILIMLLEQRWRIEVRHRMSALRESHGVIQLRHLVRCLDSKRVPLSAAEREGRQGPIPYYGASGIVDYVDDHLFDEVLVLLGEDGAQLGVPDFSISQVISGKTWVNNHAHVLRPHKVHPEFLTLFLNTFDRMPYISGGLREKITQDDMNRIKVPDVDLETQIAESSRLNKIRTRCEKLAQDLNRQIELLHERRQALITAAVTGQIEITGVAA